jgi:hypothetical protein
MCRISQPQADKVLLLRFSSKKKRRYFGIGEGSGGSGSLHRLSAMRARSAAGAAFGPVIKAFGASYLLQTLNSVLGPRHRASRRSLAVHAWI